MAGLLDGLFAVLIFVTVALTAFGIGLVTSWETIRLAIRRRAFLGVLAVNLVVVPTVGYVITLVFPLDSDTSTGVVLCAICAAGPLGLKASQISRSDLPWAFSLIVTMLTLNVISVPVWSAALLDQALTVSPGDLLGILASAIVGPVVVGMWLARRYREADRLSSITASASNITLVIAVIAGIIANLGGLFASLSSWVFLAAMMVVAIATLLGGLVRGDLALRRASTLVTLNRATSVALLVIARAFPEAPEMFTAAVVFGLVQTVAALGLSFYWGFVRVRPARAISV